MLFSSQMNSNPEKPFIRRLFRSTDEERCSPPVCQDVDDFYHEDSSLPVYCRLSKGLSAKEIYSIILEGPPEEKLCTTKPVRIQHNTVFVVDLESQSVGDLTADDNGVYIDVSCPIKSHKVRFAGGKVSSVVEWRGESADQESDVFVLKRQYGTHKGTKEKNGVQFKRIISTVKDNKGQPMRFAVIQYFFKDSPEIPIFPTAPGNSKDESRMFFPTSRSTLQSLKQRCSEMNPSNAYDAVHRESGDIMALRSISEEPRDKKQAYNSRHSLSATSSVQKDEMLELHSQLRSHQEESGKGFLREISVTDSPHAFLALEDQLDNVVRFCTSPTRFSVLGVDATFKLGDFFVTLTTYKNLMLRSRRTGKHPVFLGPSFIHMSRNTEDYLMFTQAMVRKRRELVDLKAYGTDNEDALRNALRITFANSVALLCRIHKKENIEHHLHSTLKVSHNVKKEIVHDVFGQKEGSILHMGLYDAKSEEDFDEKLSLLRDKWEKLTPGFYTWFQRFQSADFKQCMISSVREAAQIIDERGGQVEDYTTNDNESENFGVKQWTGFEKSSWPDFIDKLRRKAESQIREEDKSLYGSGEYELDTRFQFLQLEPGKWHTMTEKQRLDYRRKARSLATFQKAFMPEYVTGTPNREAQSSASQSALAAGIAVGCVESSRLSQEDVLSSSSTGYENSFQEQDKRTISPAASEVSLTSVPSKWVADVWEEAEKLLNTPFGVLRAAGANPNARSVASTKGPPHYVERFANGKFTCDSKCFKYKSARICCHTVAAAQDMGHDCLQKFLEWRRKLKREVTLTPLVVQAKTKEAAGKKSDKPNRKSGNYRGGRLEERRERIPVPCNSPKPWMSSNHPFEAVELKKTRAQLCAGCKQTFKNEEPPHGIILRHPEKDFIAGTNKEKITPTASPRYYHVDIQCIRRRHVDWKATIQNVKYDAVDDTAKLFIKTSFGLNED